MSQGGIYNCNNMQWLLIKALLSFFCARKQCNFKLLNSYNSQKSWDFIFEEISFFQNVVVVGCAIV
jgi:hypothetical protein